MAQNIHSEQDINILSTGSLKVLSHTILEPLQRQNPWHLSCLYLKYWYFLNHGFLDINFYFITYFPVIQFVLCSDFFLNSLNFVSNISPPVTPSTGFDLFFRIIRVVSHYSNQLVSFKILDLPMTSLVWKCMYVSSTYCHKQATPFHSENTMIQTGWFCDTVITILLNSFRSSAVK